MNTIDKRNIAEQVEKNKQDILKHFQRDEVLADFGIRIIGQLESAEELPATADNYGDAYAVGTKSPFNYFIWTRANNLSPVDYWFDFGEIAIAGPQGPKGDKGDKGDTGESTRWYLYSDAQWNYPGGKHPGDMALTYPSGNVYIVGDNGLWDAQGNIKGPQGAKGEKGAKGDRGEPGPQGPQGPTGDVGGFINIGGIVSNEYELPDPAQVQNLTVAFLVGNAEPYNLYIQVGSTSANAEWMDVGPLNVATMVTVNGQFQNTWNADTKVDKIPLSQASGTIVYIRDHLGNNDSRGLSALPAGGTIPIYNRNSTNQGVLKTSTPEEDNDCANKSYVDDSVNTRVKSYSGSNTYKGTRWLYGINGLGNTVEDFIINITQPNGKTQIGDTVTNASIAAYNLGCLSGRDPVQPYNYATKNYVDNAISTSGGPITVPVDGLEINWDGDGYFDVPEEDFVYRITPYILANYGQRDEFYYIQFEPVILPVYGDMTTQALSRGVISPTIGNVPDITELQGLELFFRHSVGDGIEISIHLNEPGGLREAWDNTELSLTIIVERLY